MRTIVSMWLRTRPMSLSSRSLMLLSRRRARRRSPSARAQARSLEDRDARLRTRPTRRAAAGMEGDVCCIGRLQRVFALVRSSTQGRGLSIDHRYRSRARRLVQKYCRARSGPSSEIGKGGQASQTFDHMPRTSVIQSAEGQRPSMPIRGAFSRQGCWSASTPKQPLVHRLQRASCRRSR